MLRTRTMESKLETREESDLKVIEGYFAVFNSPTEIYKGIYEEVAPEAFNSSISNDIRALLNHNSDVVLGRTKAGTLELKTDSHGLWGSIKINPNDTDATNLWERVKRGDVNQCSFGFNINSEEAEYREDGTAKFRLLDVDLWEVSPVTFPAYDDTGISARKKQVETEQKRQLEVWKMEQKKKLKGDK